MAGTWDEIGNADAILFGATGSPEYDKIPAEAREVDQLLRMRKELDLFCNCVRYERYQHSPPLRPCVPR